MDPAGDLLYKIAFASLRSIAPAPARDILALTGSEQGFFETPASTLSAVMSRRSRLFDEDYRRTLLEKARRECDFIASYNIRPIYFTDPEYPQRLLEIPDAPLMIYTLGECDLNRSHMISIVGTRHLTPYGADFINRCVADLAQMLAEPPVIVSGLAYGADVTAHQAAISNSLPTIGVLAHGLNTIYPAAHRQIAAEMVRGGGMLLTDYTSAENIHRGNFLARNRIVAGLTDCTIVAESATKGGALVTARLAGDYSRDVFALPGRTSDRFSQGCNGLIASNMAQLVTSAEDIIKAMRWPIKPVEATTGSLFPELTEQEQAILDFLNEKPDCQLNMISANIGIPVGKLMSILIDMEFRGLVIPYPGGKYRPA
ncbi:MAG: DNA-processing protein DprA [Paramuribaculum sp.]|nr:DNA-processing protein DprA [Paramuribaculum sp.]